MTQTLPQTRAPEFLPLVALGLAGLLAALYAVPAVTPLVFLALAAHALRGPMASIQALSLLFVVVNLNPGLFPSSGQGASLRWLVLLAAFGRAVWDGFLLGRPWPGKVLLPLGVFVGSCITLALVGSRLPLVSVFKLVAFTLGAVAVLAGFYRTRTEIDQHRAWFLTLFVALLTLSAPLNLHPLGYVSNGRGFQGLLVHPQVFGPIAAPVTAWLIARFFFERDRTPLVILGIGLGLLAVFTSQARTGALMIAGGLLLAGIQALRQPARQAHTPGHPAFPGILLFIALAGVTIAYAHADAVRLRASGWIQKRIEDTAPSSFDIRATMVDLQLENFYQHPLTGIGFGLPSRADDWARVSTGFLGLPTGFTAEKGFLPSAVLEETGVIGAVLLVFVLAALLTPILQHGSPPILALAAASLLANAGEMVFFSFGGPGLYYWLLLGMAYASSLHAFHVSRDGQETQDVASLRGK